MKQEPTTTSDAASEAGTAPKKRPCGCGKKKQLRKPQPKEQSNEAPEDGQ